MLVRCIKIKSANKRRHTRYCIRIRTTLPTTCVLDLSCLFFCLVYLLAPFSPDNLWPHFSRSRIRPGPCRASAIRESAYWGRAGSNATASYPTHRRYATCTPSRQCCSRSYVAASSQSTWMRVDFAEFGLVGRNPGTQSLLRLSYHKKGRSHFAYLLTHIWAIEVQRSVEYCSPF